MLIALVQFVLPKIASAQTTGTLVSIDASGQVSGWIVDSANPTESSTVAFYIDTPAVAPWTGWVANIPTYLSRTDVDSAPALPGLGFSWIIPKKFHDNQAHTLYAYSLETGFLLSGAPQTFKLPYASAHLKYMGGPYNPDNATIESFSNLILVPDPTTTDINTVVASLQNLRTIGKKGIFLASNFFVLPTQSATQYVFNSSYVTTWNTQIAPTLAQYSDVLVAYYLIDEPDLNLVNPSDLQLAIAVVKASLPNIKATAVFSSRGVYNSLLAPFFANGGGDIDWVGMDCYSFPLPPVSATSFDSCPGYGGGRSIPDLYTGINTGEANLSQWMVPGQQFVMIANGYWNEPTADTNQQTFLANANAEYFQFAMTNPLVVAMFPFRYSNITTQTPTYAGFQNLPITLNSLEQMGQFVLTLPPLQMDSASSDNILAGWPASNAIDGNMGTVYSSNNFPTSNPVFNGNETFLGAWLNLTGQPQTVQSVVLGARTLNGAVLAFPQNYDVYVSSPTNSEWVYIGNYQTQPDVNGFVVINLPAGTQTYGTLIVPTVLGVDNNKNYYFQMAEVQMQGP